MRGENNPYEAWLAMYESAEFQAAASTEQEWLNERLAEVTPNRFKQLSRVFNNATRLEIDFWVMGLSQQV